MQIATDVPEDLRTAEHHDDITAYQDVRRAWQRIELVGSQAEAEIEDLTEATIGGWKPPLFG